MEATHDRTGCGTTPAASSDPKPYPAVSEYAVFRDCFKSTLYSH